MILVSEGGAGIGWLGTEWAVHFECCRVCGVVVVQWNEEGVIQENEMLEAQLSGVEVGVWGKLDLVHNYFGEIVLQD